MALMRHRLLSSFVAMTTVLYWFRVRTTFAQPKRIPLGALFDLNDEFNESLAAFRHQVDSHNNIISTQFKLEKYEKVFDISDSYQMVKEECSLVSSGIFALVGMTSMGSLSSVDSFARTFNMPFVTPNSPDLRRTDNIADLSGIKEGAQGSEGEGTEGRGRRRRGKTGEGRGEEGFILFLRPVYFRAIVDVMRYFKWRKFYYVYDSNEGLSNLEHLFDLLNDDERQMEMTPVHLPDPSNCYASLRTIDSQQHGKDKHILLDISTDNLLQTVLNQILHLGMHKTGYDYILGGLAMDELDVSTFRFGGVNLTGLRLVDREGEGYEATQSAWTKVFSGTPLRTNLTARAALAMDSVQVVIHGLTSLFNEEPEILRRTFRHGRVYNGEKRGIQCRDPPEKWIHGRTIIQHFKKANFTGLTGFVAFDSNGFRRNFKLDVISLGFDRPLHKIGTWNDSFGLYIHREKSDSEGTRSSQMTVVITSVLEPPYLMYKKKQLEDGQPLTDNDRFEGLCADLASKMAAIVQFDYVIRVVADGNYGVKRPDGTWNGMIGELMKESTDPGMADVAVAPLTISSARERVVDFTKPFMNLGISIMIKKPEKQKPGVFSFMDPLSMDIWTCIVFSYLGVSLSLFLVGRISPYETQVEDGEDGLQVVSTDFNLLNSLWFSLGAFMQQGCGISPRSMSGRLAGSSWWFFTLILISSYTANLAAFLTVERMLTPINSADDLVKQSEILYGTRMNGSTMEFFETSNVSVYQQMWQVMSHSVDPMIFPDTTEAGVTKVRGSKGKYAFLLESTMNDYYNQKKPCNTFKVGENLDSKGYGVATRLGHPLRVEIGLAVLQLVEGGELAKLQKKWWIDKGECPPEGESKGGSSQSALTLSNVAGIFYILIGGLGLAMLVSLLEFLSKSFSQSRRQKKLLCRSLRSSSSRDSRTDEPLEKTLTCSKVPESPTVVSRKLSSQRNSVSLV